MIQDELEQLKAVLPDSRIRQVRGRTALEFAAAKEVGLDDVYAARTGGASARSDLSKL